MQRYVSTLLLSPLLGLALTATAVCPITSNADIVSQVLKDADSCPQNVHEFKKMLENDGLTIASSLVANRGRHNPQRGSFSFFEVAAGFSTAVDKEIEAHHLYFGHFTHAQNGEVVFSQGGGAGALLIELIAWDFDKQVYNFYELIGQRFGPPIWQYRGDSLDALADNKNLHLQKNPAQPEFGSRMRCSGCHTSGGPIMKELAAPHNDWWTEDRGLIFAPNRPAATVNQLLAQATDAAQFAKIVSSGIKALNSSRSYQDGVEQLSLREQLRPLFCTTEINLVSDLSPLGSEAQLGIPTEYFVNPLLYTGTLITIDAHAYQVILQGLGFRFPETNRIDADHGWLAPVKGYADLQAIQMMIAKGLINSEFAADVLAIDFHQPLFSAGRCELLKLVPTKLTKDWLEIMLKNLRSNHSGTSKQLLDHLTNPLLSSSKHREVARNYAESLESKLLGTNMLHEEINKLAKLRKAVFTAEISQNPRGQILEPGFRVIFPVQ